MAALPCNANAAASVATSTLRTGNGRGRSSRVLSRWTVRICLRHNCDARWHAAAALGTSWKVASGTCTWTLTQPWRVPQVLRHRRAVSAVHCRWPVIGCATLQMHCVKQMWQIAAPSSDRRAPAGSPVACRRKCCISALTQSTLFAADNGRQGTALSAAAPGCHCNQAAAPQACNPNSWPASMEGSANKVTP